jgi:ankyrin repeat protein
LCSFEFNDIIRNGNFEEINNFLNNHNINTIFRNGYTALHMVISKNNFELIQLLLDKGANINIRDSNGNTPLNIACSLSIVKVNIIKLLIDRYVVEDININIPNNDGDTALSLACKNHNIIIIDYLLKNGAIDSINNQNNNGETPLLILCNIPRTINEIKLFIKFNLNFKPKILYLCMRNYL